jgi:hypothetical protein
MRTYQVYTANDAGEIVCSPEVFLASDDVAAIERVQRSGRCVELWQGLSPREAMGESSRRTELSRQMTNAGAEAALAAWG